MVRIARRLVVACVATIVMLESTAAQAQLIPLPSPPGNFPSIPNFPGVPNFPGIPGVEIGHKTNKGDVRRGLENGWWVAYGNEIGYAEYYAFAQAVGASVASENPGPAMAYLEVMVQESARTLIRNAGQEFGNRLAGVARDEIVDAMDDAIRNGRIRTIQVPGIELQVGVATYNRSESGVPLPNTFQPYLRMRLVNRPAGNGVNHPGQPQGFRTGRVVIRNNYGPGGTVHIRLYHPQGNGQVFGTWRFEGQQSGNLQMNSQNFVVGSDWGIQIVFGNGVTSRIRPISEVGTHQGDHFAVDATRILE